MSSPTDIELMDQVRDGDIRQLAHLFNRHHLKLFNYYLRLTSDRHVSEDMVQEVFFRMLKYRHTFRGDGEFLTWMYHLARNVHMDHYKKWKHQPATERIPVPLTDPNRPVLLKVGLISGGIAVKGYAGKEVIVEATMAPEEDEDSPQEKPAGKMKRIPNTSMGLTAEEEDNTVSVSTGLRGISHQIDLVIQAPSACSMKLSTVNGGDIRVENVNGDLEVNNTNGSIVLKQIAGSAVAQTVNGEVRVEFTRVNADKAMSFSSLNGDIDVTFPASLKATVQLKSEQGEIYSDFDVQMQKSEARVDKNDKGKGKYRVTVEKTMRGTINGGGQEIQFNNFNGSIYIRKGN